MRYLILISVFVLLGSTTFRHNGLEQHNNAGITKPKIQENGVRVPPFKLPWRAIKGSRLAVVATDYLLPV